MVVDRRGDAQQEQADGCDLPAEGEGLIFVAEFKGMGSGGQGDGHHYIAHQMGLSFLTVHQHRPAAVLGDGGVEQAVPVTVDGAGNHR